MAEKRARKPRAKKEDVIEAYNPNNIDEKGEDVGIKMPGRPEGANKPIDKKEERTVEILIQTPHGRLDRKTYLITKAKKGTYRKCIKIEKGVKA